MNSYQFGSKYRVPFPERRRRSSFVEIDWTTGSQVESVTQTYYGMDVLSMFIIKDIMMEEDAKFVSAVSEMVMDS